MKVCQISQSDRKMAFIDLFIFPIGTQCDSRKFVFLMKTNSDFPQPCRDDQWFWGNLYPGSVALCLLFEELRKSM